MLDHHIRIRFVSLILCAVMISACASFVQRKQVDAALGEKIAAIAQAHKGCPYRYGGTTPQGFDCSGFTAYVFKKAGITIPRTVSAQYHSGRGVSKSDLRKGDLVFFTRWGILGKLFSPWHVGIYIGNNQFVHAPSSGKSVRADSLNDPYWQGNFKGARDLL